jgi:Tfp pilus assembly protein PilV
MFLNKNRQKNKGSMMVEIIIAATIISISVLAAISVANRSIIVAHQALHMSQAAFLLEEGAENTRIARDNNWNNIVSLNSSEQIGIFTRTIVASSVNRNVSTGDIGSGSDDSGTKLITVTVSWNQTGRLVTKTLKFYISNIF